MFIFAVTFRVKSYQTYGVAAILTVEWRPMETMKSTAANGIDDEEVVTRVLNGEKSAYEQIMRKYNQRLFRIVRTYIADEDEIEDIIQEAYIKAYEQMPNFERRSTFSTWLIRIVINEALARLKKRKRFASYTKTSPDDFGMHRESVLEVTNGDTPMGNLMNAELKDILEKAVDRLPEKYRTVFLMREIEGMSVADTGKVLDISQVNVKVRLNRAKEMMRETISHFYHDVEIYQFDLVRCDRIVHNVLERLDVAR